MDRTKERKIARAGFFLPLAEAARLVGATPKAWQNQMAKDPSLLPPTCHVPGILGRAIHRDDLQAWVEARRTDSGFIPRLPAQPRRRRGRPRKASTISQSSGAA